MTIAKPAAPSVLIAGLHKTGTTGVYDTVRSAVSDKADYTFLFEPKTPDPFRALGRYAPYRPIVAKILINKLEPCAPRYDDFDRRIMTIRDPRDTVVSRLLFRPMFGTTSYHIDLETLAPFVDALREKEADPNSHSVKALHDLADELGINNSGWPALLNQMRQQLHLIDDNDFFVLRYEDFVDGRLDEASEYLGVPLVDEQPTDDGWKSYISRSRNHGEWKRWFLDEDIEYFGDMFAEYLDRFGYSDWEREAKPKIDPATSSDYVTGKSTNTIVERQNRTRDKWAVAFVRTREELSRLESMAMDGRVVWAHRVARVYDESPLFGPDRERALSWARHGAVLGHAPAMALLARFLRERGETDRQALLEARFWQREHDALKESASTSTGGSGSRSADDLKRTKRTLGKLRSSARYRLGSALAEAATNPRRRAHPAAAEIGRHARYGLARNRRG